MAATSRGLLLGVALLASCASAEEQDPLTAALEMHDTCLALIEQEAVSIQAVPAATTIKGLVTQTVAALSPQLARVVQSAARTALPDIRKHDRGELATVELLKSLRKATYSEFGENFEIWPADCGFAAFEVLPNLIYRYQRLDRKPLREEFDAIGLRDSHSVERSLMLMLTLEASGEPWQSAWFAEMRQTN